MEFFVISRSQGWPVAGENTAYLKIDHWNDFSFVTMFEVRLFDEQGALHNLGTVKIGLVGQTTAIDTYATLTSPFVELGPNYFSVGQDESYYRKLFEEIPAATRTQFLSGMRDVVFDPVNQLTAAGEEVFRVSLLRYVSLTAIEEQFRRILAGGNPLSDFNFAFTRPQSETSAGIDITFRVNAASTPSTNIHAIIGRNGVGKTRLLNDMTAAIVSAETTESRFSQVNLFDQREDIGPGYFSSLLSISFSAFDPFAPPREQADPEQGTRYFYVGLKDARDDTGTSLKSLSVLRDECSSSVLECLSEPGKRARWRSAIGTLESDENFQRMNLANLADNPGLDHGEATRGIVERMSSGHAVVLLTISRLVAKVEEKTLVLIDEPESHLHPPLLSALTRALSELLHNRNGVAIIATHSPVVLQEVPRSCVWLIDRSGLAMNATRPRIETFGENVGVLTHEVFGLEVSKSGFHSLLHRAADAGDTYEAIVSLYANQLGHEARGILRAMIADRDRSGH